MVKINFDFLPKGGRAPEIISFKTMRMAIGVLAVGLPFILIAGPFVLGSCASMQDTISAYYHTRMRDFFVGILCAIAFFLFAYKGYDAEDFLLTKFAGLFAIGVALCPTMIDCPLPEGVIRPLQNTNKVVSGFHYAFAGGLFAILACISLCLFTKTKPGESIEDASVGKKLRNDLYVLCGIAIMVSVIAIPIYDFLLSRIFHLPKRPLFWLETSALVFFGLAWIVKSGWGSKADES
jgi:hypothetical protein